MADPEKIQAVKEWSTPKNRKDLQRFPGFANFNQKFIKNYSQIAPPLTKPISLKKVFFWNPKAEAAFC